jgi:hypothetical protein
MKSKTFNKKLFLNKTTISRVNFDVMRKLYGGYDQTGPQDPAYSCLLMCPPTRIIGCSDVICP